MWCEWWPQGKATYKDRDYNEVHIFAESIDECRRLLRCHIDIDAENKKYEKDMKWRKPENRFKWHNEPDMKGEFHAKLEPYFFGDSKRILLIFSETEFFFLQLK